MPVIYPTGAPVPVAVLGWDGTDFRVISVDIGHRQNVRGEDQLFSFRDVLDIYVTDTISGADGHVSAPGVGADQVWVVTTVVAVDITTPTTAHRIMVNHAAVSYRVGINRLAIAAGEEISWGGHLYLETDDFLRVYYEGGLAGDVCRFWVHGYRMTREV